MPAFMAHYTCGVLAQQKLYGMHAEKCADSPVGTALASCPNVFHVGLAGPDLFFYSLYEQSRGGMNIGRAIHKYRTDRFLQALYKGAMFLQGEERDIALAYFAGYLGHYCLDASTHPFIYRMCNHDDVMVALGKHFRFEAAMDARITEKYLRRDIDHSYQMGLIRLRGRERRVIAELLTYAIHVTYPDAPTPVSPLRLKVILLEYALISNALIDPAGIKEWIVLGTEKLTRGYSVLSALCINRHVYGTTEQDFKRFDRRFQRACREFVHLLPYLDAAVNNHLWMEQGMDAKMDGSAEQALFKAVGSRSYHTGRHEDGAFTEIDWQ